MSTDTIMLVRIGITSPSYDYVDLPANRHDWLYRLGRRYKLPESWRRAADAKYRDLCIARCRDVLGAWNPAYWVAVTRCHGRYAFLRTMATFAWTRKAVLRAVAWNGES
jgi:hypothetical protein